LWVPQGIYHLTVRGNNRQVIFLDIADYRQYLLVLHQCRAHSSYRLLAFALMPNHVHLVIQVSPDGSPSDAMHWISTSYTRYFNERHQRVGHLYQGRFFSNLVNRDAYLFEVTRYVHLNPVRARLVEQPSAYPWSSYRAYLGLEQDPWALVQRETVLSLFGASPSEQIERYRRFVEELAAAEIDGWIRRLRRNKLIPPKRWLTEVPGTFPALESAWHF